jgi:cytidylate kinase
VSGRTVITIDGPAASGKSSTAQWVADKLGFLHVDSGSLYRAMTAAALRDNENSADWQPAALVAHGPRISLRADRNAFIALIDGVPVEEEIRGQGVTSNVSLVARMAEVRAWVNEQVRAEATRYNLVVDGRDIGTAVFPEAPLKIFLIADPWERARRRLIQRLQRSPLDAEIARETEELVQRDARDATQSQPARDAIVLDTTYLTQAEQVDRIVALANALS